MFFRGDFYLFIFFKQSPWLVWAETSFRVIFYTVKPLCELVALWPWSDAQTVLSVTYEWSNAEKHTPRTHLHADTHTHTNVGEKDRAYLNGLSCCQNVWYALATDSSGIAGSTARVCMRVHACESANTHTYAHIQDHMLPQKHRKRRQIREVPPPKPLIKSSWEDALSRICNARSYWSKVKHTPYKILNTPSVRCYVYIWFNNSESWLFLAAYAEPYVWK